MKATKPGNSHSIVEPCEYDRKMDNRRNEIDRLSRRLKDLRRIFPRFGRHNAMFIAFINSR
ncbi:hypothetical protein I6G79_22140 [Burkholderia plantarii]|nr:hypothetical protein [Burkholderia plantarii]